ncbi:rac guanine nucleotide exchange factor JJ-like [Clytia hemisphaerica]|uniref:Sushi domain-containing protein n=1 Tax=Clytia hemisphaerica TaxID=252671 RepID=A0A7M5UHJ3_9CNID
MIVLFFVLHCLNWTTNPVAYEISSSQSSCQNIPPPQNGRMQCNHQTGKFCTLQCDPGFEPQYEPAKAYLCNSNNGRWITYPEPDQMPWPDCVARKQISYPSTGTGQSRKNVERSGAAGQLSLLGSALKILKTFKKAPRPQATDYNRNIDSNQNYYASYKKNNFGNQEYTWTQNIDSPYQYFYNVNNLQRSNEQGKTLDQNILRDNPIEEKSYSFVQNPYLPNVQLQPEAMTKPQPDQSSVVTGVPIYGDKKKLNDQWKAKTTRRINGIALDRPQYTFTDNKKLVMPVDAKREEVSKTTTNLTGNRNTTRHEETNVLDADQIGKSKDDKKAGKQKTKHSKKPKEHGKIYQQRTSKTKNKHGSTAAKFDHKTQKDKTEKINKEVNTTSNEKINKTAETKPSDSVKPIEATPQNTTKHVDTHLTGLATNLLNKTNNLSYQTLEEHRDNRTQHSQIDVTNVNNTRMEGSSQQETDIENISIATTKGVVPLLHNVTAKDTLSTPTKENVDKDLINRNFSTSTPTEGSSAIKSKDVDIKTTKDANVNKNSSREIFDKNVDRNMKLFDNSKQSFTNDTSSLTNNDKPLQALIHIEISHTPLKGVSTLKSPSDDSPATRDNIHMNTEEAKNFLEKLLGDNEENNKIKNEMTSKIIDTDENALDSRSIDLEKLQDARQTEIDQIIRKYFKDAELHSTDSAYNVVPPVPVFSSRDLRLLRLMVENTKNTKRSGLNNQAFTLWEKMLELTAERRHTSLEKHNLMGKLVSRKKLAEDDSKLANVIMKKVNNIDSFAFESKTNPFLELLKKNGGKYETALKSVTANKLSPESSSKKAKTYASFRDLYLDHVKQEKTMTNDPGFQEVRPASDFTDYSRSKNKLFMNEEVRPAVDFTDYSRSKNQLFMNDLRNKEPKASIVKYIKKQDDPPLQQPFKDNQPKLGSRRQYVWNGATFVPMEDRSAPSSYLNTDQGLSEKPSYKWTGASFIENDNNQEPTVSQPQPTSYQPPPSIPPSTPVPLPPEPPPPPPEAYQATSTPTKSYQEITNQEIQNILNLWNGDGQTHTEASSRSDSERPSTQQDPLPPSSPTVPIYEKDQEDNQVLYHWNGNSYQPIQTTDILPPHTIKYKSTVNGYVMTPESGQYLPTGGSSQDTASQQRDETNKETLLHYQPTLT